MNKQHFLLRDVAKRLHVKPYRVAYALSVGLVEEPDFAFPTRGSSWRRTSSGLPSTSGRSGGNAGRKEDDGQ